MKKRRTNMFGVNIEGDLTINGPMYDIHDNKDLHFYNWGKKPKMEEKHEEDEPTEEWELRELKFFDMEDFDNVEKQIKLSKALRRSALKIDRNNGREWFGQYAAYRYAKKQIGVVGDYVDFFTDIEALIPDMLHIHNIKATGDLRYKNYTKALGREVVEWYVDDKKLPPVNSLVYRLYHFKCNETRFMKLKPVISELYKWLNDNM